jgi:hypothetical protein
MIFDLRFFLIYVQFFMNGARSQNKDWVNILYAKE